MPTSDESEVVAVGRVGRPHGVDGAFLVEQASDDPQRFEIGARLLADRKWASVVLSRRVGRGRRAIKLDRPVELGMELTVPRADLPTPAPGSYYIADLVGLEVVELGGRRVGVVTNVIPGVANDNLELDSGALVPLVEDAVARIDVGSRLVVLNPGFTT